MGKIAIIPWGEGYMDDNMFNLDCPLNRDNCFMVWIKSKEYLNDNGWEVHTIDKYVEIESVDIIVFFHFDFEWYEIVREKHLDDKTIYVAFEPPVVDKNHTREGMRNLLKFFKYILTWNDDLVDNNRIFKFMYPYYFDFQGRDLYNSKKLLVNISGNKFSYAENELYSERKKIISYFDDTDYFDLFGPGWEKEGFKNYKGIAKNKSETYSDYIYAICLENMKDVKGYITEKILDCFCAGVIPIYLGAKNISDYIPDDTYIHYEEFSSINEMKDFLLSTNEEERKNYLLSARRYLESSEKEVFLPEMFAKCLLFPFENSNGFIFRATGNFHIRRIKSLAGRIIKWL